MKPACFIKEFSLFQHDFNSICCEYNSLSMASIRNVLQNTQAKPSLGYTTLGLITSSHLTFELPFLLLTNYVRGVFKQFEFAFLRSSRRDEVIEYE
jgi:hypothetical protein